MKFMGTVIGREVLGVDKVQRAGSRESGISTIAEDCHDGFKIRVEMFYNRKGQNYAYIDFIDGVHPAKRFGPFTREQIGGILLVQAQTSPSGGLGKVEIIDPGEPIRDPSPAKVRIVIERGMPEIIDKPEGVEVEIIDKDIRGREGEPKHETWEAGEAIKDGRIVEPK
jgi:hypothetical protein